MKLQIPPDSTSVIAHIFAQDTSASDGSGKTGLTFSDITAYSVREGGTLTQLTLVDITTLGTWDMDVTSDKLGFKLLHDTNAPGGYEVNFSDNVLAAGANQVTFFLRAADAFIAPIEIQLSKEIGTLTSLANETRAANVRDQFIGTQAVIESRFGHHTFQPSRGALVFVDPDNGASHGSGARGGPSDPYALVQDAHDNAGSTGRHDLYILVAGAVGGGSTITEDFLPTNEYSFFRGPGRDLVWRPTANNTVAITVTNTDGCMFSGFQLDVSAAGTGSQNGIEVSGSDFFHAHGIWFNATRGDAIQITNCDNYLITNNTLQSSGASGAGQGIQVLAGNGQTGNYGSICGNRVSDVQGDGIQVDTTGGGTVESLLICGNVIHGSSDDGIDIVDSGCVDTIIAGNTIGNSGGSHIEDSGTTSVIVNNEPWTRAVQETTITGLVSQTVFNLTNGSSDDNAYNGMEIVVEDKSTRVQIARGLISDYDGGNKTITLVKDPGVFTIANGDRVAILASATASGVADEVLTGATHNVASSLGKRIREIFGLAGSEGAAVWFDSNNGTGGTGDDNGISTNPSNSEADTMTMLAARGYARIRVASGSTFTLGAALEGIEIFNSNWTLVLNNKSISGSCILGANVSGIATGANPPKFIGCSLAAVTLPPCTLRRCGIGRSSGQFTGGSAGQFIFKGCFSEVPGAVEPDFNFSGLGSATGVNQRDWFGGANYTLDGDCTLSHEVVAGGGTTVTTGGADVEIRGTTRSVTLVLSNAGTVQFAGLTGPITVSGTATTTVNLYGISSTLADTSSGTTLTDETTSKINYMGSGMTSLDEWLGAMAGKQTADATALTEIKATGAGSGGYSEATDSLEALRDALPSGGITITPITVTVDTGLVSNAHTSVFQHSGPTQTFIITDSIDTPVDVSGESFVFKVFEHDEQSSDTIFTRSSTGGQISVAGDNNNEVSVSYSSTGTGDAGSFRYVLRNTAAESLVRSRGNFNIVAVPSST